MCVSGGGKHESGGQGQQENGEGDGKRRGRERKS